MIGDGARTRRLTAIALAAVTAAVTLRVAWVGDDALITLRTILNASHGWGWGFNTTEAVQGYTHPLWFGLWLVLGSVGGQWLLTVMLMGVACTTAAVLVALLGGRSGPRILVVGGVLMLSNAFVEYATSGLENSLGYLQFAGVIVLVGVGSGEEAHESTGGTGRGVALGLLAAALLLTRMDYLVLLLPVAALWVVSVRQRPRLIVAAALAAVVPLAIWFGWAWSTYGYLLPSTFEAKTNLALPRSELLATGVHYLTFSLAHDPATTLMLVVGCAVMIRWGGWVGRAWVVGIVGYLAYVVWIGGDFMIGRFLAVPVFIVAAVAVRVPVPVRVAPMGARWWRPWLAAGGAIGVVALLGVGIGVPATSMVPPAAARWDYYTVVLSDERGVYADKFGTLGGYLADRANDDGGTFQSPARADMASGSLWELESAAAAWPTRSADQPHSVVPVQVDVACGALGAISIFSGAGVHVVDQCALTDRFLATLPGGDPAVVALPGHHRRAVPAGYLDAVRWADPSRVQDPELARRLAEVWARIRQQS